MNSLVKRFVVGQISMLGLSRTLFMLPFHSGYIYGTWRRKEVREKTTKDGGTIFMWTGADRSKHHGLAV